MKGKKIISFITGMFIFCSMNFTSVVFAEGNVSIQNQDKILTDFGYKPEIVSVMQNNQKDIISKAITNNPSSVKVVNTILVVDNLSLFEYYTNTTDEELLKTDTAENVKKIRSSLQKIDALSEKELESKYSVSPAECKLLKKSLKKNPNYNYKRNGDKDVSTSSTLDSSWMYYTMSTTNQSTFSAPEYFVSINYNWQKTYFCDVYNDKIAVAWGGGLNVKNFTACGYYCHGSYYTSWGDFYASKLANPTQTPQAGIVFEMPQAISTSTVKAENKYGAAVLTLYQSKLQGYDTTVISQFCHQELAVGTSISISNTGASVALTPGTAYCSTPQASAIIKY